VEAIKADSLMAAVRADMYAVRQQSDTVRPKPDSSPTGPNRSEYSPTQSANPVAQAVASATVPDLVAETTKLPAWCSKLQPGGDNAAGFVRIPTWIIERDEFYELSGGASKLLVLLASQYNGRNNGDLRTSQLRRKWKNIQSLMRATDELLAKRWIIKTKAGGFLAGSDLFAVTWWPVDACNGKHGHKSERILNNPWMKT
jgi:hypothetical protein